ncbi:MAG: DUF3467 domain-containing protein [Candidatus Poseidoniales archaeon]|nr:MAG: DUF3467 domain-containing protein [Candidatus Poseidoniales archaeon]
MEKKQTITENELEHSEPIPIDEHITRSGTFAKHYCTNVHLYHTEYDFRLDILNEQLEGVVTGPFGNNILRREKISEAQVILQPHAAKILFEELKGAIQSYEEHFGQIEDRRARA